MIAYAAADGFVLTGDESLRDPATRYGLTADGQRYIMGRRLTEAEQAEAEQECLRADKEAAAAAVVLAELCARRYVARGPAFVVREEARRG
jgi:hypothetical protein